MPTRTIGARVGRRRWAFTLAACWALGAAPGSAQPPTPTPTPAPGPAAGSVEARLRQMEERFEAVSRQNQTLTDRLKSVDEQNKALAEKVDALSRRPGGSAEAPDAADPTPAPAPAAENPRRARSTPVNGDEDQPPDVRTDEPTTKAGETSTKAVFGEGFKWETPSGEFQLQFHQETQLDLRAYEQAASDPVNQVGLYAPRVRFAFNGRVTKPIEYSISFNKGLGTFDLLDAYVNFNYDKRFQLRAGRYRVPFMYEWFALANMFLTTPERSIFALNYGSARNLALMGHGELFGERVDYAVAAANGPRNSYTDANSHKDVLAYLNYRPFFKAEGFEALKNLNVGGSAVYGIEDQNPYPVDFRTSKNATDSAATLKETPSFLRLNNNVSEKGVRSLWDVHLAYYYKQFTLIASWESGFNDYAVAKSINRVRLPTHGYSVATGFFLTGETVERRTFVNPLRPFDLRKGQRGPGAFEVQARFSEFHLGDQVFSGGLADPNLWTNEVYAIDAGVNWYLNRYVKVYFDWQHSVFGSPVLYRPGGFQKTSDLFWLRLQLYF